MCRDEINGANGRVICDAIDIDVSQLPSWSGLQLDSIVAELHQGTARLLYRALSAWNPVCDHVVLLQGDWPTQHVLVIGVPRPVVDSAISNQCDSDGSLVSTGLQLNIMQIKG